MKRTFQVKLDRSSLGAAQRGYLMRRLGLWWFILLSFTFGFLVYLFLTGAPGFMLGMIACMLAVCILIPPARYLAAFRNVHAVLKTLGDGVVSYELEETCLRLSHRAGNSEIRGDMIRALWRFRETWLLLFRSQSGYLVFPAEQLNDETKAALEEFVRAAGGRVI